MRLLKKALLAGSGVALSGFLVSACAKDPLTAPSTPSVAPAENSIGTMNAKSSSRDEYQRVAPAKKTGAHTEMQAKKRSGYMVSSS